MVRMGEVFPLPPAAYSVILPPLVTTPLDRTASLVCDEYVSRAIDRDSGRDIEQSFGARDGRNRRFVENAGGILERRIDRDATSDICPGVQHIDLSVRIQRDSTWIR